MTGQDNENRLDLRVTFRTTALLSFSEDRTFDGCETMDLSVSGAFVKGVSGVGVGEKCRVEIQLSGRSSTLVFKMTGEAVRIEEGGAALQFLEVDEDSFYHLQNIVYFTYKNSGGTGEIIPVDVDDVDDESLYYDLDSGRKAVPLPGDYLDEIIGDDGDDYDDDPTEHLGGHVRRRHDEDDY